MVAEQSGGSAEPLVEEQIIDALVPQMAEQWLEEPKIFPQDRILQQIVKQIADRLEAKRDLAGAEKSLAASGKVFADELKAQAECMRKVGCNRCVVGRVITGVEQKRKFKGEEQLMSIVEKCAAKVEGELQKKMVTETGENGKDRYQKTGVEDGDEIDKIQVMKNNESVGGNQLDEVDGQIKWAVREGRQLMESLTTRNQDIVARTGSGTSWDIIGSPQKSASKASLAEDGWKG